MWWQSFLNPLAKADDFWKETSFLFDISNLQNSDTIEIKAKVACVSKLFLKIPRIRINVGWIRAMVNENGRPIFEEKKAAKQRPANDDKEGGRVDETTAPCVHISGWLHRRGRRCNHLDDEIWMIVFSRHRWLNLRSLPPAAIMLQIDRLYGYRYWLAHPLDNPLSRIHFFTALLSAKSTSFTLVTMDPMDPFASL